MSAAGGPGAASHGRVSEHGDSTGQILGGGSGGTAQSGAYGHARPLPTKAIGASSDASGAVGLVFQARSFSYSRRAPYDRVGVVNAVS